MVLGTKSVKSPRLAKTTSGRISSRPRIKLFISYASEDKDLVGAIFNLLTDTFRFGPLDIYRDVEIKEGKDYAKAIDKALDEADILLVIFTERLKMSHSFTGYEVGYFHRSIQQHPRGRASLERIFIPFCIGADIPDTMHFIQGVSVGTSEAYRILKTKIDTGTEPVVDEDHPVFKLLARISELVGQIAKSDDADFGSGSRSKSLAKPASALYRIIHEYLQSRVSSETYPERKLIIRTSTRPEIERDGVDLTKASVELVGDFLDIFAIPTTQSIGRSYSWSDFQDKIPPELRSNCIAGIRQLTAAVLKGGGDNYHVVTTVQRDKAFRLFVSKVVTYVSQKTEIDIYVVQIRTKEYGDRHTSRLLKAIAVGLRFRFLVLEEQSEFRPEKLGHPIVLAPDLRAKILEMLGQMDLILRDAVEADLYSPDMLILIWGRGREKKVQAMMDAWEATRQRLYSAAEAVLNAADDHSFKDKRATFIGALIKFCEDIEEMNQEFTSRVLALLADHVRRKIGLPPSTGPRPPGRRRAAEGGGRPSTPQGQGHAQG